MIKGISAGGKIASAGMEEFNTLATQRVIGYTRTIRKAKKKSVETKNVNLGIQAWEIGAILAGSAFAIGSVGAYEYLTGNSIKQLGQDIKTGITSGNNIDKTTLTGSGSPHPTTQPNTWSNLVNFFKVVLP